MNKYELPPSLMITEDVIQSALMGNSEAAAAIESWRPNLRIRIVTAEEYRAIAERGERVLLAHD